VQSEVEAVDPFTREVVHLLDGSTSPDGCSSFRLVNQLLLFFFLLPRRDESAPSLLSIQCLEVGFAIRNLWSEFVVTPSHMALVPHLHLVGIFYVFLTFVLCPKVLFFADKTRIDKRCSFLPLVTWADPGLFMCVRRSVLPDSEIWNQNKRALLAFKRSRKDKFLTCIKGTFIDMREYLS
jgi:hypothetical protein